MRAKATTLTQGTVLVVENDSALQTGVVAALQAAQYDVLLAANHRQAAALRDLAPIDIVVLDADAPAKDPSRQLTAFVARSRPSRILVITRSLEQLALASGAGADAFLLKPVELARMVAVVNHLRTGAHTGIPATSWPRRNPTAAEEPATAGRYWEANE